MFVGDLDRVAERRAALTVAFLGANLSRRWVDLPTLATHDSRAKALYRDLADPNQGARIVATDWNAFARTDAVRYRFSDEIFLYTDGDVPTNIRPFRGDLHEIRDLTRFLGYFPFFFRRPQTVLSIGPGGGLDILMAQLAGCREITGVELNPSIPRLVDRFRDVGGPIYHYTNVHLTIGEGRSFVRRCDEKFDLIYAALTFANTTQTSNLAFVDSYVHTREAFEDYLAHLTPQGRFVFMCQLSPLLLRAVLTAREALMARGIPAQQTPDHMAVVSIRPALYGTGPYRHLLIVSQRAFSPAEAADMGRTAFALDFVPGFCPGAYEPTPFSWLRDPGLDSMGFSRRLAEELPPYGVPAGFVRNLKPVSDDSPFFVDLSMTVAPGFRRFALGIVVLCVAAGGLLVVYLWRRRELALGAGRAGGAAAYFGLLGVGFMIAEICLAQKLTFYLGYPVLSLGVILFALLLGGAAGGIISQRREPQALGRHVSLVGLWIVAVLVAFFLGLRVLLDATLAWPVLARSGLAMVILLPLGFLMGQPFPCGLRAVGFWGPDIVPWCWGLNGLTSVLGSVLAMIGGKLWGFSPALLLAAAAYLTIAALAPALLKARERV